MAQQDNKSAKNSFMPFYTIKSNWKSNFPDKIWWVPDKNKKPKKLRACHFTYQKIK